MLTMLFAQAVGSGERVGAVQSHFAGRTSQDGLRVIITALIIAVLLCVALVALNRIQQWKRRRAEAEQEKRRRALTAPRQDIMGLRDRRTAPQGTLRTAKPR